MARVLILGGGFGGLAAANELRNLLDDEHEIILVDRRDRFFMGFAKLWDLVGARSLEEGSRPLANLNDRGIRFVQAEISAIDAEKKFIETSDGRIEGNFLVAALGSSYNRHQVSNLLAGGHNLYDAEDLPGMRRSLEGLKEGKIVFSILGLPYKCPPAPYEATFVVDDLIRRTNRRSDVQIEVYTPQPSPLPIAGPEASKKIATTLAERDIPLFPDHKAAGADGDSRILKFENGSSAEYTVLFGVPQHVAPDVISESGLTSDSGWIEPDRQTFSTRFDGVYAVGDCVQVTIATGQLPKAGVFAEAEGLVAARNIATEIQGGEPASFDGHGYCFLDWADGTGSYVEGNFFAEPKPDVAVSPPETKTIDAKLTFERERLERWL
jgi:sulfide:quinone oxidoreductase